MGGGVANDAVFEAVAEERLNRELPGPSFERIEILNFAVGGYSAVQSLMALNRKALAFQPDAVIMTVHGNEAQRLAVHLMYALYRFGSIGIPEFDEILRQAGVSAGMPAKGIEERIQPYMPQIMRWVLAETAEACRAAGIVPAVVYIPATSEDITMSRSRQWLDIGRELGFVTMNLEGVYEGRQAREIQLAPWDIHPNELGHRLIGERFHEALVQNGPALGMNP
jgi:hypothetical protein